MQYLLNSTKTSTDLQIPTNHQETSIDTEDANLEMKLPKPSMIPSCSIAQLTERRYHERNTSINAKPRGED